MARPDFRARYGSWALVAGASEGLGAEFAIQLAAKGLHLFLIARRPEPLDELRSKIVQQYGVEVRTMSLDLGRGDAAQVIEEATRYIEIGLLVYNAAFCLIGTFFEISLEDHLNELAVNCRTPMVLALLLGQPMIKRGRGGIILMSSMSAMQGTPLVANYGATKAYNQVLAEGLWEELRAQGVDVLAPLPPPVKTPGYLASAPSRSMPALMPDAVVSDALAALGKRSTTVPGLTFRLASNVMQRLLPRKGAIAVMSSATRGMYGRK